MKFITISAWIIIIIIASLSIFSGCNAIISPRPPFRTWKTPALLAVGNVHFPRIVCNKSGNFVVVWLNINNTTSAFEANYYVPGTGWGTNTEIDNGSGNIYYPPASISIDKYGNAIAVWSQGSSGTTNEQIWANRYIPGTGWGTAIQIDNNSGGAAPQVSFDNSGNAIAVWSDTSGTWTNHYIAGAGWDTAVQIKDSGDITDPAIAFDNSGNITAVWYGKSGICANRYISGIGWGTPVQISSNNLGEVDGLQVVTDNSGNAIALWSTAHIWANHFTPGAGWGAAVEIDNNSGNTIDIRCNYPPPQVAFDGSGNAIAVWEQQSNGINDPSFHIWTNRFIPGSGWGVAAQIDNNSCNTEAPQITVDTSGEAIAVWFQNIGANNNIWSNCNIWYSFYSAGTGWSKAQFIHSDMSGNMYWPYIAGDGSGNAIAVWLYQDEALLASRYSLWNENGY